MNLSAADHQNLEDNAREFRGLLQDMANKWTHKNIGCGHAKSEKGKGAQLVRTMRVMRSLVEESLSLTQGRSSFWKRADQALNDLLDRRWNGKWQDESTWLLLRSWNETLQSEEE